MKPIYPLVAAALALACADALVAQDAEDSELATLDSSPAPVVATDAVKSTSDTRRALELPARNAGAHQASNLFPARSWFTPPPPPPAPVEAPPPAPTAPPLPFTFVGSFEQGGTTVYFLVHGERSYDVKVGDVIDATYSVDGVSDGQLLFTYLPLRTSQTLALAKN